MSSNHIMGINLHCSNPFHLKSINVIVVLGVTATIIMLLNSSFFSSSPTFIQYASAVAPVAQITSAKSGGSDVPNGGTVTVPQGQTTAKLTFEFKGFDDNDHVVGFLCSWDGTNYLGTYCSSESAESRSTFTGPDGVTRTYYVKTGTALRDFAPGPTTLSYTFGVKVINDNNSLSPAATWTFKVKPAEGSPPPGEPPTETKQMLVQFDSITVHNDHDSFSGDWSLYAYVQGKLVDLSREVDAGKTYTLRNSLIVDLGKTIPLSIFTVGNEWDCDTGLFGFLVPAAPDKDIRNDLPIFDNPALDWWHAIGDYQAKVAKSWTDLECGDDPPDILGTMMAFHDPPGYDAGRHEVKSSNGDFTLRYTVWPYSGPR